MAYEFKFPDVGEGIHEGEIVKWRVKVGDEIKEDQPLVDMETAKAVVEIPSPRSGTILALIGKEGDIKWVGATLAVIGEKGEKWTPPEDMKETAPGVIGQIPTEEKGVVLPTRRPIERTDVPVQQNILPRARKIAQELCVDLSMVKGSGPGGQITEENVRNADKHIQNYAQFGPVESIPLKGVRKAIAEHMVKSKFTIPHVTHMDECDATALIRLRESKKAEAEKKGIKLTFLPFIIKAAVETLKKHPALNAAFTDEEIIYKKYYNIGVAVDTPDGLMVPVIKDADTKDVFAIAQEIMELAEKSRNRTISLKELQGGSFSITNIGSIGGIYATPIISYGQTANLGVMRIKEKPVAVEGKVVVKPMLSLALSYDHRVVDGAEAARFMNDLISALENVQ